MGKRLRAGLLVLALCSAIVLGLPLKASAFSGLGAGTTLNPYLVSSCLLLQEVGDDVTASYALTKDIDCSDTQNWNSGAGFVPIGYGFPYFSGTFDGQNHTISNIYINPSNSNVGLFGLVGGNGLIENVTLTGNTIGFDNTGSIAGVAQDNAVFDNVHTNVTVSGTSNTGGLVGHFDGNDPSTAMIENSSASGHVSASDFVVGGLLGAGGHIAIKSSWASGNVATDGDDAGGLVGIPAPIVITNSFSTGNVTAGTYNAGGLVGMLGGGSGDGGSGGTSITNSWASGNASASTDAGELAGHNYDGSIADSFAVGKATTDASHPLTVNGLVGTDDVVGSGAITDSFYNSDNADFCTQFSGTQFNTGDCTGISLITYPRAFFDQTSDPVSGWDFTSTWHLWPHNYPHLQAFVNPELLCYEPHSTSTTFSYSCLTFGDNPGPLTWHGRYRIQGTSTWTNLHNTSGSTGKFSVSGARPGTEYEAELQYVGEFGAGHWGKIIILTSPATTIVGDYIPVTPATTMPIPSPITPTPPAASSPTPKPASDKQIQASTASALWPLSFLAVVVIVIGTFVGVTQRRHK